MSNTSYIRSILLMIGKMIGDMMRFITILIIFFTGFTLGMTKVYLRWEKSTHLE